MKAAHVYARARLLGAALCHCVCLAALAQTPPETPSPSAPAPVAPPPAAPEPTQKIGGETKLAIGKVIDLEKQDNGCLLNFTHTLNGKKAEAVELGLPEFCTRKPPLKGATFHFVYKMQKVLADECLGNPRCKKTEERAIIVEANPLP
jgi:hypothetical protein